MSKKMMKRSLALGALMAFVITGSAMAKVVEIPEIKWDNSTYYYHTLQGSIDTVKDSMPKTKNDRTLGGWYAKDGNDYSNFENGNLTVSGGSWDLIAGANYLKNFNVADVFNVSSTNVTITGGTAEQVYGGMVGENTKFLKYNCSETNLLIKGGTFGQNHNEELVPELNNVVDTNDVPEFLVVGGDLFKIRSDGFDNETVDATINTTNLKIENGIFNSAIVGGSAAVQFYSAGNTGSVNHYVKVDEANTVITGGKFNHAIVAGGFAYGDDTKSEVTKIAKLTISGKSGNLTINDNIYAGGMTGTMGCDGVNTLPGASTVSTVEEAVVDISNAKVNDVYGTGVYMGQKNPTASPWGYIPNATAFVNTDLTLTNVIAQTVDIPLGTIELRVEDSDGVEGETSIKKLNAGTEDIKVDVTASANGEVNDAVGGSLVEAGKRITIGGTAIVNDKEELVSVSSFTLEAGEVAGETILIKNDDGTYEKIEKPHEGNAGISDISSVALMAWRAETNDMNKRLGELRNANGEHGVWVRMVRGESEYNSVKNQYNQYQLGYDEKLSVDKSWTVGMALSYTDAESSFSKGSGENTHKGLAIYGSKLNDDGSFIDLIAKYSRLEHDFDLGTAKGDYDTNGYSVSAEYGKRFQQGNGLWIEPQVELTYGQVDSATYMVGGRTVNQDAMESLVGRVGFSLGKDISKGNVYARASYLYDFEGESSATYTKGSTKGYFEQDLGGGWWEVGVGANINLSKATYIYADIEKTFGGEVDTNWQWNLGVRYSF